MLHKVIANVIISHDPKANHFRLIFAHAAFTIAICFSLTVRFCGWVNLDVLDHNAVFTMSLIAPTRLCSSD